MFCDNCENADIEDETTTDNPDTFKDDLEEICRRDPGTNFFMEFAQALGIGNSELFS